MIVCPLCHQSLREGGATIHAVWQEMESDEQTLVAVHLTCAWSAVRDILYHREGECEYVNVVAGEDIPEPPSYNERWVGWEPMPPR